MLTTDTLFVNVFHMSLSAFWLILAICLLRLLLKKAPKSMICLLWGLVALRLLCPISIESSFSLIPTQREIITDTLLYAQAPVIETGMEVVDQAIAPVVEESLTPQVGASVNPIQVWMFIAEVLWMVGMGIMLLYAAVSRYFLRRRVAVSIPDGEAGVRLCDGIDTPFILGIFRPQIYLPSVLEEEHKRYVLAHEQAHIRRKDHLWKALGFLILTIHWFNPLCWLAYILFSRDLELACDEMVIRSGTVEYKKAYSEALLTCSLPSHKKVFCPLAFGEVGVKDRIRTVLLYKKPTKWIMAAAVVAMAIVALGFMTDRVPLPEEESIFDKNYEPFRNIYASPPLVESDYEVQYLPSVYLDGDLKEKSLRIYTDPEDKIGKTVGRLEEVQLTRDNFDILFREQKKRENGPWSWPEDESWFRRNNYKAWRVIKGDDFYMLLLQKDGSVLLCHGYYDAEGEVDPYSDDSSARWMVLLNPLDDAFAEAETPYQWSNNITSEQIEWVSVTVWGQETVHYQPTQEQITQLTSLLRSMTPDQVYASDVRKQHTVSVMVYCYGREYLLQYAGDGIVYMTFDSATASLYEDKRWVIEDEQLGQWMEQWSKKPKASVPAQWQYMPHNSSDYPAFPVFFDFDYTKLNLSGPNGTRKLIIGGVVDNSKIYAGGNGFCWSPLTENLDAEKELIALNSEVEMAVTDAEGETLRGTLYFEVNDLPDGDPLDWASSAAASSLALPIYTIQLESEDLYIAENPDGEGILLAKIN